MRTAFSRRITATTAMVGVAALGLAACSSGEGGETDGSIQDLAIIAPADPGGGWDQTARAIGQALIDDELVSSAPVTNIGGAGGTVGLASLATETEANTLLVTGTVMVGAVETNATDVRIEDTTPIARLTEEPLVVVVPASSEFESIGDLVDAWVEEGPDVVVTGGSAGGADHILAGLILTNAGVSSDEVPDTLNYIANSGGGEATTLLLGNNADVGISGVGEFAEQVASGDLRALAVSSAEPAERLPEVPTLIAEGVDVELTNWRGVLAPGGISDEEAAALTDLITEMHGSESWTELLETNGWTDSFETGEEFQTFLTDDIALTQETLRTIGLIE